MLNEDYAGIVSSKFWINFTVKGSNPASSVVRFVSKSIGLSDTLWDIHDAKPTSSNTVSVCADFKNTGKYSLKFTMKMY